ncbi:MAG: hypothetical protein ABIO70_21380 [Pseudomonadota bacterium]
MTTTERTWVQRNLLVLGNRRKQVEFLLGSVTGAAWVPIMFWLMVPADPRNGGHDAGVALFRVLGSLGLFGVVFACGWFLGRLRRPPIAG